MHLAANGLFPTTLAAAQRESLSPTAPLVNNRPVGHRVLIAEDDGFTRMLLRGQLDSLGYDVVGDASSANEAMDIARNQHPEIALLDLDLGRGPTGIDLAYGLREMLPTIGIVLLTSYADVRLIGAQRELPVGSVALVKRMLEEPEQLDAALTMSLDIPAASQRNNAVARVHLSDGQAEILRLVANGFSNAEIARRAHLSESAVIKALGRLFDQLGIEPKSGDNNRVLLTQAYFHMTGAGSARRN